VSSDRDTVTTMLTYSIRSILAALCFTCALATTQGCNGRSDTMRGQAAPKPTDEIAVNSNFSTNFRAERDQTIARLTEQRVQLDREIEELSCEINRRQGHQLAILEEGLAELKRERQELIENIAIVEEATAETWQDIKIGFSHVGHSLDGVLNGAEQNSP